MRTTRREFIVRAGFGVAAAGLVMPRALAGDSKPAIRLSACDWSLGASGPEGLASAAAIGLDGLEVSAAADNGKPGDVLAIADPERRQAYKQNRETHGVAISSVAMGLLNGFPMVSEPRAPAWVEQTIDGTKDLGAKVMLLAFFGKGDLRDKSGALKEKDVDTLVGQLTEFAPKAEKAGVILGIENTLSAEQNLDILGRVKSNAVRVYYDVGNSTHNGYDVGQEIRLLGDRICQIHFKDNEGYLGEGEVNMNAVAEAMHAISYKGWVVLETKVIGERDADFKRNAQFTRTLLGIA
ncbi:MAG TPA: sugar phosphate isomerase/epimerase family protein [Candidatus Hydrogenedentes bacterium]|nr:sugar phosphate isomerase/epimerase family protein [Candidatus Hydrogenedentota bacterium]